MSNNYLAQALIDDAAIRIGVRASGVSLSSFEYADCLIMLNKIIDQLSGEGLELVQVTRTVIATGGLGPFTTPRPIKIIAANCIAVGGFTGPVQVCEAEEFAEIRDASTTSALILKMFCDFLYPTSDIYIWPSSAASLILYTYMPLTKFADLAATPIDLPNGYPHLLTALLAVEMCEMFERPVTQSLGMTAQSARQMLAGINTSILGTEPQRMAGGQAPPAAA